MKRQRSSLFAITIIICLAMFSIITPEISLASNESLDTIYYVSTQGNDSNPGTQSAPWKTVQKAANCVKQGDTVYIRGGVYNEKVILQSSGSENNYITFASYPDEVVTIDGTGIDWGYDWNYLFNLNSQSYVKLAGLRIVNSRWFGIGSAPDSVGCDNIIIENCSTYNTKGSGIIIKNGTNIILDGNSVEKACTGAYGTQECITLNNTTNFEIKNNHVFNCTNEVSGAGGEGIDVKDGSSNGKIYNNIINDIFKVSIYVDSYSRYQSNIEVYGNTVYNTSMGIAVATENNGLLENVQIYNNLVYNCVNWGLAVSGGGKGNTHAINDVCFKDNTTFNIGDGGIYLNNGEAHKIVIANNFFGGSQSSIPIFVKGANLEDTTIDNNTLNRVVSGYPTGSNYMIGVKDNVTPT